MPLMKLEPVSLSSANVTEKMVQEQIADDPSILGLGKLELRDKERVQAHVMGRLAFAILVVYPHLHGLAHPART